MADITSLAAAIQQFEGWSPGSVSQRNNNPGNLRSGPGMIGTDSSGYAIFPDYATGWDALLNQVQLNVNRGLSLDEFFAGKPGVYAGYAPAADSNQPYGYAATVAGWLGVDPSAPLYQQLGSSGNGASSSGSGAVQPIVDLTGDNANLSTDNILAGIEDVLGVSQGDPSWPSAGAVVLGLGAAAVLYFLVTAQ